MTLLNRLTMALIGASFALHASAAPIEFTINDFEQAAAGDGPALTVWFDADQVRLKRLGDIDLDAPQALPAPATQPQPVSVPEPVHYKLMLTGMLLLLLAGARRRNSSPWNAIKVSQQAD
jgi:hypothetical protein